MSEERESILERHRQYYKVRASLSGVLLPGGWLFFGSGDQETVITGAMLDFVENQIATGRIPPNGITLTILREADDFENDQQREAARNFLDVVYPLEPKPEPVPAPEEPGPPGEGPPPHAGPPEDKGPPPGKGPPDHVPGPPKDKEPFDD